MSFTPRGMILDESELPTLYAKKKICIELLDAPEVKTKKDQTLLYTRLWDPSTFELGPLVEVLLEKSMEIADMIQILSDTSGRDRSEPPISSGH